VLPSTEAASSVAGIAAILPSITAPGVKNALKFSLLQPRVGITWAVDEARKTQLRFTYSMFTNQIGAGAASFLSVAQYRGFYLTALDANGDHIAQPSELLFNSYPAFVADADYWGYDPANPTQVSTPIHKIGTYGNPKTHEFIVGIDHELAPNLGVSASYTFRRNQDFNWRPIMCSSCTATGGYITGANYTYKGVVTGTLPSVTGSPSGTYTVPYYGLATGTVYDPAKGTIYSTRPDYYQNYQGFEMSATKRMSNHWMARLGFSTNSWREYFDSNLGMGNPTPILSAPNQNGGLVVNATSGSGKSSVYLVQPKYQVVFNGAYQLPLDFDIGASYLLRQGFPMPWNYSTSGGFTDTLGSTKSLLLVNDVGAARLPAVQTVDVRVGKRIRFFSKVTLSVDLDVFNLFNSATILGREYRKQSTNYTNILEVMQPRIMRIGGRITF